MRSPRFRGVVVRACRSLTRCLDVRWNVDVFCRREVVKLVEGVELVWGGLDGVSGLLEKLPDAADVPVDRFGSDVEERGDRGLWESETVVEQGGQQPVGKGEDGAAAGAWRGESGAVATSPVQ